jgi:hypothetical protein
MTYLKETTVWDTEVRIPNHTYIFNKGACVGYIKEGTTEKIMFKKPSRVFSKRYRTFEEVKV